MYQHQQSLTFFLALSISYLLSMRHLIIEASTGLDICGLTSACCSRSVDV